jgi:hypothetical protein
VRSYETRFPVHPSDFFLENEIKKGSGLKLQENGVLRRVLHDKVTDLWSRNLDELVSNTPVLVHYSSFFWNICLESDPEWRISRLTACSDSFLWDASVNLSLFRYPPFISIERRYWESLRKGYKNPIDNRKITLYAILITLMAATGTFYEPKIMSNIYSGNVVNKRIEQLVEQEKAI